MKKKVIPLAVTALLFAAGVGAQDSGLYGYDPNAPQTIPDGYDNAGSEKPEGYDSAGSEKPAGYDSQQNVPLSNDMQAMVDDIVSQQNGQMLSGDEGLACEAILCLSSATRPGECAKSLARYFGINLSKPWKTIQARINFLKMCPSSSDTPQMNNLVEAIGNGAGRCDAASLNVTNRRWIGEGEYEISDVMPSYCDAYFDHEYTDINSLKPHYVDRFVVRTYTDWEGNTITEYDGGYWVDGTTQLPSSVAATNGAVPASKDPASVGF